MLAPLALARPQDQNKILNYDDPLHRKISRNKEFLRLFASILIYFDCLTDVVLPSRKMGMLNYLEPFYLILYRLKPLCPKFEH